MTYLRAQASFPDGSMTFAAALQSSSCWPDPFFGQGSQSVLDSAHPTPTASPQQQSIRESLNGILFRQRFVPGAREV
jgi:hypothetical protein